MFLKKIKCYVESGQKFWWFFKLLMLLHWTLIIINNVKDNYNLWLLLFFFTWRIYYLINQLFVSSPINRVWLDVFHVTSKNLRIIILPCLGIVTYLYNFPMWSKKLADGSRHPYLNVWDTNKMYSWEPNTVIVSMGNVSTTYSFHYNQLI